MAVWEDLSEDEAYLFAILDDQSGIDQAEFLWFEGSADDGCWRFWPFQWPWLRANDKLQIDMASRSVGKTMSIVARMFAFPIRRHGQEAVITAPELIHLEPIVNLIEERLLSVRLTSELLPKGRSAITHRPFMAVFRTGARILGRIPQRDGRGVKGLHPVQLEQDECFPAGTLVLTERNGLRPIETIEVGESVLTHRSRWRSVTKVHARVRDTVIITGQGHPGLECSENQQFWARPVLEAAPRRRVGEPEWVKAPDIVGTMWSAPIDFPATEMPEFPFPSGDELAAIEFCGQYVADGSISYRSGAVASYGIDVSVGTDKMDRLHDAMDRLGLEARWSYPQKGEECFHHVFHDGDYPGLSAWFELHFGRYSQGKKIPTWLLGLDEPLKRAFLAGALFDGFMDPDKRYVPGGWKITTTSWPLAVGLQMLGQSLSYTVNLYINDPPARKKIKGRWVNQSRWYQVVGRVKGQGERDGLHYFTRAKHVSKGRTDVDVYDLTVEDDYSFIADGRVVWDSQDYGDKGFRELNETLKTAVEGSEWRAHGVTKGVRGEFYRRTQPNSGWKVHRLTAMHRPSWTDEERQLSLQKYGGHRDDPDFRRNVYGEHGDQTAALFVMSRLAKCIDDNKDSPYNTLEYQHVEISDAMIAEAREQGRDVADLLVLPESHRDYTKTGAKTWGGMDVGLTVDPSEILVFAEYEMSAEERKESQKVDRNTQNSKKACPKAGATRLKLLLRLSLKRVTNPDQIKFILAVIDFYQLERFSLDRTGIGFPLWQDLQNLFREAEDMVGQVSDPQDKEKFRARAAVLREAAKRIKGYNFSEKVIVDIDDTVVVDEVDGDPIEDAAMRRTVLEHSTDLIRRMVDEERLWLPWDVTLIAEYEGQTISFSNSPIDQYGKRRRVFAEGKFHAFDASRMFAMGIGQQKIEALVEKPKEQESVFVQFG